MQVLRRQNSFYVLPDLTSIPKVLPIIIKLARLLFVVFSAKNLKYEVHNEAKIIVMIFGLTCLSTRNYHSRSKQRTDQRVLVLILTFLALKNWVFPHKEYFPISYLTFVYLCSIICAIFHFGPYTIFKKKKD